MSLQDCIGTCCARFSPTSMRECKQWGGCRHEGCLGKGMTVSVAFSMGVSILALGREG